MSLNHKERNPNVFKTWQKDTKEVIENCLDEDFKGWKLSKFVKDEFEQNKIMEVVRSHYAFLKDLFISVSVTSNFPFIT